MRANASLILALSLFAGSALADGGGGGGGVAEQPLDPEFKAYSAASAKNDWSAAAAAMRAGIARDPVNADFHNLYAYALRKGANPDMGLVFKHYNEALRLDTNHLGAHEYIGEAYLMIGNLPKAKEHLARLDKLCFFSCAELRDLKKAVAQFESRSVKR